MQKQQAKTDNAALCKELSRLMQDAHAALTDSRSRNAEQAFRQALALLETTTPKVIKTGSSHPPGKLEVEL